MRSTDKSTDAIIRFVLFVLVAVAVAWATGRLSAHHVNDTPSYLDYPLNSLSDAMLSIRTPGYPLFLAVVRNTLGIPAVPFLQVLLHAVAAWIFFEELLSRGMASRPALACALSVLFGCTATDHISTIATDAPGASLAVITAVMMMRSIRTNRQRDWIVGSLILTMTIMVRPAYLFLIPWVAVAGWMLDRRNRLVSGDSTEPSAARASSIQKPSPAGIYMAAVSTALVLCWMSARAAVVQDFGIVPFGHQNLSAILVQTVTPETLRALPDESGRLGAMIADEMQHQGLEAPDSNSSGIPTMTIESQWGQINYQVIWPLARDRFHKTDQLSVVAPAVAVHRRIGNLNKAILAESPQGYIRWLILAARRAMWGSAANITMHPLFATLILILGMTIIVRSLSSELLGSIIITPVWCDLALIAITYAVMSIGFVILSSPPIGRFADAGAIFLPSLFLGLIPARNERE